MGHGGIIIFMVDGAQIKLCFQRTECAFYFPDGVINISHGYFVFYLEIGA